MTNDPYMWLENIDDEQALAWVEKRNSSTIDQIASSSEFDSLSDKIRAMLDSDDRIPGFVVHGDYLYNFWQDAVHVKGIWRRTTLEDYKQQRPDWSPLLSVDELAEQEGEEWVWKGHSILRPECDRALIHLSKGGGDAVVVREFDIERREFVEGGFYLPEAKSDVCWAGRDRLIVGTDFGPESLTDSGYPMTLRIWDRNTPLSESVEIFRGEKPDVSVGAWTDSTNGFSEYYINRSPGFFSSETYVYQSESLTQVEKPEDANAWINQKRLFLRLKTDWTFRDRSYKGGSLLVADLDEYIESREGLDVVFEPSDTSVLESWDATKNSILLSISEDVRTQAYASTKSENGWKTRRVRDTSEISTESIQSFNPNFDDRFLLSNESYLVPSTLSIGGAEEQIETLKQAPAFFDAAEFNTVQFWTTSRDGTKIPYFEIRKKNANDAGPTLLYGYGGFEISMLPLYSASVGLGWLERGGTYVVANIRGGGEFGPDWHRSALKENRHRAFDDFIAVAEDLIERGVTTSSQLGIQGGSNGGLLMGNMYTKRPDLFGAIVCQVPLLDMSRYHLLLAGASWMAEYGDPDNPEEWNFLQNYSPYHNVKRDQSYPPILITTSTRDDRVHPGHARKMVALLEELGHPVTYYENTAGGHAGSADNSQLAFMITLVYEFLWNTLSKAAQE
ncbi:MAG: prolyl oligopeptidase family serine peptidase [Gammaproteobacteria bacterium]|nr:prolyl oligopeptidase family serine peptidase [Gammaproteobacteria bacterium]